MPDQKKARFVEGFGLSPYDAGVLVAERESADFYETVLAGLVDKARDGKLAANWVINELFGRLNKEGRDISGSPVSAEQLAAIVDLIGEGTISGKIAKDLFEIVWQEGGDPRALVETRGMKQVTDLGAIEKVVDDIIAANPDKVAQAKAKPQMVGWFVGQVMKSSGGKANPQVVNDLLKASSASEFPSRNGTGARHRRHVRCAQVRFGRASRGRIDRLHHNTGLRIGRCDSSENSVLAGADETFARNPRKFFYCQNSRLRVRATRLPAAPVRRDDVARALRVENVN